MSVGIYYYPEHWSEEQWERDIKNIAVLYNSKEYTAIQIETNNNKSKVFIISNENNNKDAAHKLTINNKEYTWQGAYTLTENE